MTEDEKQKILSNLSAMLDDLAQEKVEEESKPWPQVGDGYWCAAQDGSVYEDSWCDDHIDHYRLATGNCHRTETEALAYQEWQTDPRVVARGMIERMVPMPVFGRYSIYVRKHDLHVQVEEENDQWTDGGLRFESEKQAREAIAELGEPLIKVALGVITDKEEGSRIVREAMGRG